MSAGLKTTVAASLCVSVGWLWSGQGFTQTQLTFLSVGQGDCAVLQHQGRTILIDAAPSVSAANWDVLPKLRSLGVSDVDLVLLTHPDMDHVGGIPVLARAFPGAQFAISQEFKGHPDWQALLREWRLPSNRLQYLPKNTQGTIGDLKLTLYCPELTAQSNDNDGSAFLRLSIGNASAVLSGDASAEAESVVASEGDWSAEIMKAGHHGSRTSTSWTWLQEVHPQFAVISCGRDNRYHHPHQEVVDRIVSSNIDLQSTVNGDVRFILRDGRFVLQRE